MSISEIIERVVLPAWVYDDLVRLYDYNSNKKIIISSCDKEDFEEIRKRLSRRVVVEYKEEELTEGDREKIHETNVYTIELKYFKDIRRERLNTVRNFVDSNKGLDKRELFIKAIRELRDKMPLTNLEEIIDTVMKE